MKILAIRGENLASLASFELNLEAAPFHGAGVFAITGPTGAGKSTLLDAMCLALYDTTPRFGAGSRTVRVGGADHLDAVTNQDCRGILRRGAPSGFAEVDFRVASGERYRATWKVRRARLSASGKLQAQELSLVRLSDGFVFGGTKREMLDHIKGVIHLDFEQFRRSVLLAQGDFAAFLHASANDRASLLEAMTDTAIYSRVSKLAYERGRAADDRVRQLKAQLEQAPPMGAHERDAAEARLGEAMRVQAAAREALEAAEQARRWWLQRRRLLEAIEEARRAEAEAATQVEVATPRRETLVAVEGAQRFRSQVDTLDAATVRLARSREGVHAAAAERSAAEARVSDADATLTRLASERQAAEQAVEEAEPALAAAAALDSRVKAAEDELKGAAAAATVARKEVQAADAQLKATADALNTLDAALAAARAWLDAHPDDGALASQWPMIERALRAWALARDALAPLEVEVAATADRLGIASAARAEADATLETHRVALDEADAAYKAAREAVPEGEAAALRAEREVLSGVSAALSTCRQTHHTHTQATAHESAAKADVARHERSAAVAREQVGRLKERVPAAEARLAEARRSEMQLQAFASLEARRDALVEGQACPLCGSTEHPYAEGLDPVIHEQAARVAELAAACQAIQAELARQQQALEAALGEGERAALRLAELQRALPGLAAAWRAARDAAGLAGVAVDDAACSTALRAAQDALQGREAAVRRREAALDEAERARDATMAARDAARGRFDTAERERQRATVAAQQAQAAHQQAQAQQLAAASRSEAAWAELDALLPVAIARDALLAEPVVASAALRERVEGWRRREAHLEEATSRRPALERSHDQAATRAQVAAGQAERAEGERRARESSLVQVRAERAALLGGQAVGVVKSRLAEARAQAVKLHQAGSDAAERLARDAAAAKATHEGQRAQLAAAAKDEERAQAVVDAALVRLGVTIEVLRARLSRDAAWVDAEREALAALVRACDNARVRVAEREHALREHDAAPPPEPVEEADVSAVAERASLAAAEANAQVEEARLALREDDARRHASAALRQQVAAAEAAALPHKQLQEVIGSADGKKFRTFAQSLALDALLRQANVHLGELNPRYRLQRIPGLDLDLQVLDAEHADEPRAINSLSGGETFLASLALALGLSSMAAERTPVGSLFIDEGFGTLDPATLDVALDTLHGLQRQGRQVGLISHVPGIGEKLGVEVALVKRGGGRSEVCVR